MREINNNLNKYKMNIQDELQKIHHKFGVSEMANYKIEQFIESLIEKDRKEQLILNGVGIELPTSKDRILALENSLDYFYDKKNELKRKEFSKGFDNCYRWIKDYVRRQR